MQGVFTKRMMENIVVVGFRFKWLITFACMVSAEKQTESLHTKTIIQVQNQH